MLKVGMINLGCAKNQVDGEVLMGNIKKDGFELCDDVGLADIAIVNTCGFIESAKRESIEEILELATLKKEGRIKKIVVTGCLAERYKEEIMKEIPEADAVVGIGGNGNIAKILKDMLEGEKIESFPEKSQMPLEGDRELTTPSYFAYLKIAEGCDNRCTYCAIPLIRGNYRSRTKESVLSEAKKLVENGARELVVIAQDISRYGLDLYGSLELSNLLKEMSKIEDLKWIRLMYLYPDTLSDELLKTIASEDKIVKYLEIPLQHANGRVLKDMNRRGDKESLTVLMKKIRKFVPNIVLRTTFIVGFPGETEEEFTELCEFCEEIKFDKMGCFPYSPEEDTVAATMKNQVDEDIKQSRANVLSEIQMRIMQEKGEAMIGKTVEVLTEGFDRYAECYFGRTYRDAPEVDGKVFFAFGDERPSYGQFAEVEIDEAMDADLMGVMR